MSVTFDKAFLEGLCGADDPDRTKDPQIRLRRQTDLDSAIAEGPRVLQRESPQVLRLLRESGLGGAYGPC